MATGMGDAHLSVLYSHEIGFPLMPVALSSEEEGLIEVIKLELQQT